MKTCIFLGDLPPLRQLSLLAEWGGIVKSCLTPALFWPSANGGVGGRHPFGRFSPEQNQSLGGSGIASLCELGGPNEQGILPTCLVPLGPALTCPAPAACRG